MDIKGLDLIDNKILNLLLVNARMSYSEIGENVGLSRTAVKNRVKSLEEREIISGYRVVMNTQKIPLSVFFTIRVETTLENFETIKEKLKEKEQTITVVQTTGKYNLMAICMVERVEDMRFFVNRLSKEIPGIVAQQSETILDVVKGVVTPIN